MFKTKDICCKDSSSLIRLIKSNRDLLKSIPKCTMPIDSRSNVNFLIYVPIYFIANVIHSHIGLRRPIHSCPFVGRFL